jgi:L-ascorbate metabolism protein UlaG (beta-lactamase superfamily)
MPAEYTNNPALKNHYPKNFRGTPMDKQGRFLNLDGPMELGFKQVMKWKLGGNPHKEEKKNDHWKAEVTRDASFLSGKQDCLVWLGHASFFIRINGLKLLVDPVFYGLPMVPRMSEFPVDPSLFTNIDYLLISHNHRDHCDQKSIKLLAKNNPEMKVLTGLKLELLLKKWLRGQEIEPAGWYQQYNTPAGLDVFYLPSKHWSRRLLKDTNESLWGAFVIQHNGKTIYFSGDTGYSDHFKVLPELFPYLDICIIGCGAYSPRWFMRSNHIDPEDAVKAFHESGAKLMIPMHYGCFDLSDEPAGEPVRILRKISEQDNLQDKIKIIPIGEALKL